MRVPSLGPGLQAFLLYGMPCTPYGVDGSCSAERKVSSSDDNLRGELPARRSSPLLWIKGLGVTEYRSPVFYGEAARDPC